MGCFCSKLNNHKQVFSHGEQKGYHLVKSDLTDKTSYDVYTYIKVKNNCNDYNYDILFHKCCYKYNYRQGQSVEYYNIPTINTNIVKRVTEYDNNKCGEIKYYWPNGNLKSIIKDNKINIIRDVQSNTLTPQFGWILGTVSIGTTYSSLYVVIKVKLDNTHRDSKNFNFEHQKFLMLKKCVGKIVSIETIDSAENFEKAKEHKSGIYYKKGNNINKKCIGFLCRKDIEDYVDYINDGKELSIYTDRPFTGYIDIDMEKLTKKFKYLKSPPCIETTNVDTTNVDTTNVDTTNVDTNNVDTNNVDTNNVDTTNVEIEMNPIHDNEDTSHLESDDSDENFV